MTSNSEELENKSVDRIRNKDVQPDDKAAEVARVPHPSPDVPNSGLQQGISSPAFFTSLVKWRPVVGYFQYLADCTQPEKMPPDQRIHNLAGSSRLWTFFWGLCVFVDFIVLLLTIVAFAVVLYTIGAKTLG